MFPTLKHFGVGIIPWSPLARGLLARPFKSDTTTRSEKPGYVGFSLQLQVPDVASSTTFATYLDGESTLLIVNRSVGSPKSRNVVSSGFV